MGNIRFTNQSDIFAFYSWGDGSATNVKAHFSVCWWMCEHWQITNYFINLWSINWEMHSWYFSNCWSSSERKHGQISLDAAFLDDSSQLESVFANLKESQGYFQHFLHGHWKHLGCLKMKANSAENSGFRKQVKQDWLKLALKCSLAHSHHGSINLDMLRSHLLQNTGH